VIKQSYISFKVASLDELSSASQKLLDFCGKELIIVFNGDLGAGKTTFIKHICKELGVKDMVSSPTFSLVNVYDAKGSAIYHFDFYRLADEEEAYDMGYEDYFYSGNYCFVEWASKIPSLMPDSYVEVLIEVDKDNTDRLFTFIHH
jgi:tRNA threonylcarbamoyladenosine biosynthesis protein TsaE